MQCRKPLINGAFLLPFFLHPALFKSIANNCEEEE
jgi:hypothetical protein